MDAELSAHIRARANDLERSGVPRSEAERRARLEFGGYQKFKEECREALGTMSRGSRKLRTLRKKRFQFQMVIWRGKGPIGPR
jgi:hypothetical protein